MPCEIYNKEELTTPCGQYDCSPCSGCRKTMAGTPTKCFRRGRAVSRRIAYRALLRSGPNQPPGVWEKYRPKDRKATITDLQHILKRYYGPQYTGPYKDVCLAREVERYELHKFWVKGRPSPRRWDRICEGLGLKLGPDPLYEMFYRQTPPFALLKKA